jgi:uncharacterized membrane protein YeaQ/YmgE (transglycosylase-associated protein family)
MEIVAYVLGLMLTGLMVGALARLGLPGRDPMSIFETMLVGIAGTLIAGLISYYAFDREAGPGLLLSILCALGIVFGVRKLRQRQLGEAAGAREMGQTRTLGGGTTGLGTTQVRFFPGCLVGSLLISLFLTLALNLLIRAF